MRTRSDAVAIASWLLMAAAFPGMALAGSITVQPAQTTHDNENTARLESRLETTFELNRALHNSHIEVEVRGNTAVLTGTVHDNLHKELAEEIALSLEDIERVDNDLRVDPERLIAGPEAGRTFSQIVEDATISTAVRSKLEWSRHAAGLATEVATRHGVVVLSGYADSHEAKRLAEELAGNTRGAALVVNRISVDPDIDARTDMEADRPQPVRDRGTLPEFSDEWITTKIRSSLLMTREVPGNIIDIETSDGIVKLKGRIDNESERRLVIQTAENIRGVRRVEADRLVTTTQ